MKNIAIFLFVNILLFTFPTQGAPSNIQNILAKVMASDGYLDNQLHREFWTEMEGSGSPEDTLKLVNMLKLNMLLAQEYQNEAWKSVLISYRSQTVVRTDRMIAIDEEMLSIFTKTIPFPTGSSQYKGVLRGYAQQGLIKDESTKKLLTAAAERGSLKMPGKDDFVLDEESITSVLDSLSASFLRVQNLLDKNWSE